MESHFYTMESRINDMEISLNFRADVVDTIKKELKPLEKQLTALKSP